GIPPQARGADRDRHEREAGMRWTRLCRRTSEAKADERNRAVLISRRWDQPPGHEPGGTEANKPGTPRRPRISRKPSRRERRLFRLPCRCLRAQSALSLHARLAGAASIRCSLRPPLLLRATNSCKTRTQIAPREGGVTSRK